VKDVPASAHHARRGRKWLHVANSAVFVPIHSLQFLLVGRCARLAEARQASVLAPIPVARVAACIGFTTG
jgi:hypothetical protein